MLTKDGHEELISYSCWVLSYHVQLVVDAGLVC